MSFNECENILDGMVLNNNAKENFFEYVYKNISQKKANRFVEKNNKSIDIIPEQHPCIKIIPICEAMDKEKLDIDSEMQQAVDIISTSEFKYVYFVYPKNDNFDKHIQVKIPQLEDKNNDYMVKLIPYSLNRLQKTNQCCGSCGWEH